MTKNQLAGPGWATGKLRTILITCCWCAGICVLPTGVSAQQVYSLEFNQGDNFFGTLNLDTGAFTQLGDLGSTLYNDIAAAPGGTLYGIVNSSSLVALDVTNGATLSSMAFNVGGIESLAVAPNGTLYGATQSALYTINPANAQATLIGNFNNSLLGSSGQNIRFAPNGNLYDTDGGASANSTDLYQISLANGSATTIGVLTNVAGLTLENAGLVLYGVGIELGSANSLLPDLVGIDISSAEPGGTNADGSIAGIGYNLVTGNFPNNYNFSSPDNYMVAGTPIVPTPEPSITYLAMAGGLGLLMTLNRRRR